MNLAKGKRALAAGVVVVLVMLVVWLNRYRYEHVRISDGSERVMRINRFTGQVCYAQWDGSWSAWLNGPLPPKPSDPSAAWFPVDPCQKEKLLR